MIPVLVVDDEKFVREGIVQGTDWKSVGCEVVGQAKNGEEALALARTLHPLLIVTDIRMPKMDGIELVRTLREEKLDVKVIFLTAYSDFSYAQQAVRLQASDYLLKPFGLDEFMRAALKVKRLFDLEHSHADDTQVEADTPEADTVFLKTGHRVVRVHLPDTMYIEGMSEYLKVYLEGQKPLVVLLSMKRIEDWLPDSLFMRIHRSYIINLKKIQEVNKNRIIMGDDVFLPIGDNYRERFNAYLNAHYLR